MGARRAGNRRRLYSLNKLGQSAATAPGAGTAPGVVSSTVVRSGHEIVTEIAVDLGGGSFTAGVSDGHAIAVSSSNGTQSPAYLAKLDFTENGHIVAVDMTCLETPAGASTNIILVSTGSATAVYNDSVTGSFSTTLIDPNTAWAVGNFINWSTGVALTNGSLAISGNVTSDNNSYLYLANGQASGAGTYTAGKYVIRLYGIAVPDDK